MTALASAPYLDYYGKHNISPVHQDTNDLAKHFSRRDHLYRALGIPPCAWSGKVWEFGPGGGYNAQFVSSRVPLEHVLIEGNKQGWAELEKNGWFKKAYCAFSSFEEFVPADFDTFGEADIVLAEGFIPHQPNPAKMARHVAQFTAPGGVLVITTADYLSILPEVLRRVLRARLVDKDCPLNKQLDTIRPVFASHYAQLPGASRPIDDWMADTLLMPWGNPLFSIGDAIDALGDEFDVYGSSPRFITDWRWYKDIHGEQADVNGVAKRAYEKNRLNLLDHRTIYPERDTGDAAALAECIFKLACQLDKRFLGEGEAEIAAIAGHCARMARLSVLSGSLAASALTEFAECLWWPDRPMTTAFTGWFGRAQQYLSFIRRPA